MATKKAGKPIKGAKKLGNVKALKLHNAPKITKVDVLRRGPSVF